jgi:Na+(H+)/acetate symporter ActP
VEIKDRRIWITEGPLKADIASKYLGAAVVGAMSAGTWCPAIQAILAMGAPQAVVIAYDRDLETNPKVAQAYLNLKVELKKHGLAVSRAVWGGSEKGIDDALTGGLKIKILQ